MDLQGISRKGPRGLLRKAFNECMMFHLLTVFFNNAAKQEWYYLMNVLKKIQCIHVHQFVKHVEQLNSYIAQLPYWFRSPSVKPNTTQAKILFTEADLAVTFYECAHLCGRNTSTFTREVCLPWTCICFLCLLRLQHTYVCRKSPTHNLARRFQQGRERKQAIWY
jgi:hypothetical protein